MANKYTLTYKIEHFYSPTWGTQSVVTGNKIFYSEFRYTSPIANDEPHSPSEMDIDHWYRSIVYHIQRQKKLREKAVLNRIMHWLLNMNQPHKFLILTMCDFGWCEIDHKSLQNAVWVFMIGHWFADFIRIEP